MTRHDEIEEKYGWAEGEREALQRDNAERAERERRDRSAENLQWARERAAARAEAERAAVKPEPNKMPTADTTQVWETWVKQQIRTSLEREERIMGGVIADVVGKERSARAKVETDLAAVCQELAALKYEVAELKGELKTKSALADMEARLARMEAPASPARLKTIAG